MENLSDGPKRRVAARKRNLKGVQSSAKKLKASDTHHTHPDDGSIQDSDVCSKDSSLQKQPSFEGVFVSNHVDGLRRELNNSRSSHDTQSQTQLKITNLSDIATIHNEGPLFRVLTSDDRGLRSTIDEPHVGDSVPSSPLVWPGEEGDCGRIVCSHGISAVAQSAVTSSEEATPDCSPLPPTPQGRRLKNIKLLPSVRTQCNVSADWDGNDSFFERLDMDQLILNSQTELKGTVNETSSGTYPSMREGIGDCPKLVESSSPRSQAHLEAKCSVVREKVLSNGCIPQDLVRDKNSGRTSHHLQLERCDEHNSETPGAERWFSKIGTEKESIEEEQAEDLFSAQGKNVLRDGSNPSRLDAERLLFESCSDQDLKYVNETSLPHPHSFHTGVTPKETSSRLSEIQTDCQDATKTDPGASLVAVADLTTPKVTSAGSKLRQRLQSNARVTTQTDCQNAKTEAGASLVAVTDLTTPKVTSAVSRLRQRLQSNALVTTPQQTRSAELRKVKVEEALTEMLQEKNSIEANDIGPFYGLPSKVALMLKEHRGIDCLYDWQHSCLTLPAIQHSRNLIYSLPTSGGKTLVAEILIMRQLLCNKKDALLIVPFVSIVQEKVASLSTFAIELGFLVEEYAGSKGAIPPRKHRKKKTLYVATIEKAHSLVNSLILDGRIETLGLVVVDELHMLGDGGRRGASLEACIAKLLYLNTAHIIGMSATLSNIQDLCDFARAEVYSSDFRPVELKEYIKIEDSIFEINPSALCPDDRFIHSRIVAFPYDRAMRRNDPDHLVGLALEVIPYNSCLVFCATKKSCQNVAEFICKYMPKNLVKKITQHKSKEKAILLQSLRRECDNHLCPTLKRTIPFGLAYHHSGLTMDERKLIEEGYSEGTLCLLTCTSTLAAGVNLPAKRVILRSPYIAQDLLTSTRYKQMVGRAGRAGIDSSGESILIVKPKERQQIAELLSGPIEACYSSLLHDEGKGIRSLILTLVALKLTTDRHAVLRFMEGTLFGVQATSKGHDISALMTVGLDRLLDLRLIEERLPRDSVQKTSSELELTVTKLGQAAFKGSIDIDLCSSVYADLKQACDGGLVLANTLHLLFLVTPYDLVPLSRPNWAIYDRLYSNLSEGNLKVAQLIGVTERYLNFKLAGRKINKIDEQTDFNVQRFYLTLMLWELLKQTNIWDVASDFEMPRGFIQNLFTSAASFGSSVQRFCEDLPEFWAYQHLLTKVVFDLTYCATADLVSLLEVPGVKQGRAKQLVRAGYKTIRHLAHADPSQLTESVQHLPKKIAQQIVAAAKMELAERADALRDEAEELVTKPTPEELDTLLQEQQLVTGTGPQETTGGQAR